VSIFVEQLSAFNSALEVVIYRSESGHWARVDFVAFAPEGGINRFEVGG
jgi:hypothetical protein